MVTTLLIGVLTGLVSAVLYLSAATGSALGVFVLFFLSPMPIAIAGLGWNSRAAVIGLLTGALVIVAVAGGRFAGSLLYALSLAAPAALLAHLALLARPVENREGASALEWYPLGPLVAVAAVWAGLVAAVSMTVIYVDLDVVRQHFIRTIGRLVQSGFAVPGSSTAQPSQADIERTVDLVLALMPSVIASVWLLIAMINLWLAGLVVRASGLLKRPWPYIPGLVLPWWLAALFAVSLLGTALPDLSGVIAACFAASALTAYMLGGLAIVHHVTRTLAIRPLILSAIYLALLLLPPVAALALAVIALAEPISPFKRTGGAPPRPD